jgi:predicted ester cyclase
MTTEENKAIVRRWFEEVIGQGRVEVIDEILTPDSVNHAAAAGRPQGIEGAKEVVGFTKRTQPDQTWTSQRMIAEGDYVVVHGVREGTWQAESFRGVPTPTGKRVAVELVHIFRLEDGKIAEHWAVRDDLGMMQQLGALPQP